MKNVLPLLAIQQIWGFGKKTNNILSEFPAFGPDSPEALLNLLGQLKAKIKVPDIDEIRSAWKYSEKIITASKRDNIVIIPKGDGRYPRLLLKISDSPLLLHVKGNIDALNIVDSVAVVGTRAPMPFSLEITRKISEGLAKNGYTIVSGLAEGIDKEAHESALNVGGITVAVLAHGLDDVFPRGHKALAERILENNGALVSEYPVWKKANKGYFIRRNRIQSGLSLAVVVVETGVDGGTMHTASFCDEQGRILFVLNPPESLQKESKFEGNKKLLSEKHAIPFTKESCFEVIAAKLKDIRKNTINTV